jgi:hypothetical protein
MLSGNECVTLYHVEAGVECSYLDVFAALESLQHLEPVTPWVANHTMLGEDETTPRICVAESLENCISSCGLHRFRRCCENVPTMQHFATIPAGGEEAYPIIIQTYQVPLSEVHKPTPKEVPDAALTGELWLTKPTRPVKREMLWLMMDSISVTEDVDEYLAKTGFIDGAPVVCVSVITTDEAVRCGFNHPWLNCRGHCLDSLAPEDDEIRWATKCLAKAA